MAGHTTEKSLDMSIKRISNITGLYESEHGAAMEVSNVLIAYNKNSSKNEVIDCNYLPYIFLKAIEDKLGKLREKLLRKK